MKRNKEIRSILSLGIIVLILISIFSILYYYFDQGDLTIFESVYLSTVTFTSLGYGDIYPMGLSKLISLIEVAIGLILFGYLISKLVSIKQEKLIDAIYRVSYENHFRDLRTNLSDQRDITKRLVDTVVKNKDNKDIWNYVKKELLSRNYGPINRMNNLLAGAIAFMRAEMENNKRFPEEMKESYQIQRILHSTNNTMRALYRDLQKLKQINYPINNSNFKNHVKKCVNRGIRLAEDIKLMYRKDKDINFQSDEIISNAHKCMVFYKGAKSN